MRHGTKKSQQPGEQVGVIVFGERTSAGHGITRCKINARTYAEESTRAGYIVVWRDNHATIHRPAA